MIGSRLKLARSASGLSLRGLSDRIGNRVTAQAIGKYERDESMPSSGVLIALADALHVSVNYLVGDPGMSMLSVDFRSKEVSTKREEDRMRATVLSMLERYLSIEEILGLSSVNWDAPRSAPYPVLNDVLEADRAAMGLRQDWGLGLNPILNMAELMEDRGVKVLFMPMSEAFDGLTAHVRREDSPDVYVIVVDSNAGGERQRFTIAHEIGHMVLDVSEEMDEEVAAYRFAGAFLMPEEVLWKEVGRHRSAISLAELLRLKQIFGVSAQALIYRCMNLGIVSSSLMSRMFARFQSLGWRSPPYEEAIPMSGEKSGRFERLCFRALSERLISESKAAELLGVPTVQLTSLMDEPPGNPGALETEA